MSSSLLFTSSNKNKYNEARNVLSKFGVELKFFKSNLQEIQADTLEEVATYKAKDAFSRCLKPVIVEDDGLFIESLNGFPGPYSAFALKTIGNKGILQLLSKERKATFQSVIAYCDKKEDVLLFKATVAGKISSNPRGKRWGYDPIFVPEGQNKTYAQMDEKNSVSHRYLALKKFANWYLHKRESIYR